MASMFGERQAREEAGQLRRRANVSRALGQRASIQERRQARYLTSSFRARAAAGGANLADPSLVRALAEIEAQGEFNALGRQWEANEAAAQDEFAAQSVINQGRLQSSMTMIQLGSSFYGKYA